MHENVQDAVGGTGVTVEEQLESEGGAHRRNHGRQIEQGAEQAAGLGSAG